MVGVLLLSWMLPQVDAEERGDAQKGQRLYRYYCAACHRSEGTGTGRNAPYLEQLGRAPRDHTDVRYMNR
ncbi:MAG: c-type cytochrome [Candidatus Entotheonellia bacterium]